jgi:hypothetical protein
MGKLISQGGSPDTMRPYERDGVKFHAASTAEH